MPSWHPHRAPTVITPTGACFNRPPQGRGRNQNDHRRSPPRHRSIEDSPRCRWSGCHSSHPRSRSVMCQARTARTARTRTLKRLSVRPHVVPRRTGDFHHDLFDSLNPLDRLGPVHRHLARNRNVGRVREPVFPSGIRQPSTTERGSTSSF